MRKDTIGFLTSLWRTQNGYTFEIITYYFYFYLNNK